MTVVEITTESIFDCHLQAAHVLKDVRSSVSDECQNAINIQIIIASACYVEGYFEDACRKLLAEYKTSRSHLDIDYPDEDTRIRLIRFYQRLEDDFDARLRRATGVEHYVPLIEILMGEKLSRSTLVEDCYEGIINLFTLRNMFAHGRVFEKKVLLSAPKLPDEDERTELLSGYDKVVRFLFKQRIINNDRANVKLDDIASDTVADYFLDLAEKFCLAIPEFQKRALCVPSLEEWLEDFLSDVRDEYNAKHNANFTGIELLQKGVISIHMESFPENNELLSLH